MIRNRLTRIRDLIQREKPSRFEKNIDLYSVNEGVLTGVTGTIAFGYRVGGLDLLLEPDSFIQDFERRIRKILNQIPDGCVLHFIVNQKSGHEEILREFLASQNDRDPVSSRLIDSKLEFLHQHPFLKKDIFLFIQVSPLVKKRKSFLFPDASFIFGKKARRLRHEEFTKAKERLSKLEADLKHGFGDLGISLVRLKEDEIFQYLFRVLNPSYSGKIDDLPEYLKREALEALEEESLRSKLLLSRPQCELSHFYLDQYFHKGVSLRNLPCSSDIKILKDFLRNLGPEYAISIRIEVPDQEEEKSALRRRSNFHKAEEIFSRSSRHEAGRKHEESEDLQSLLVESQDKLFYLSLAVIVKDEALDECERKADAVVRAFSKLGDSTGLIDDMNHDRLFLSLLPLQGEENPLQFLVRSEALVHFLPLQSSWPGTAQPGLLLKSYAGEAVTLDLFDPRLEAKHALMIGATGSGKSFFTNQMILYFLAQSEARDVIVIDVGGSYRKLAGVMRGEYLEVECDESYAINPFPLKRTLFPNGKDPDPLFLQFLKEILERMISPRKILPSSEKIMLEKSILELYRTIDREKAPLLEQLEEILRRWPYGDDEDKRKAYRFSKELVLFTQGEYGKLLNRPSRFDIESRFTVFDIRKIAQYPELQEILLLIIPFALRRKFEDITRQKLIILDECWQILKETQGRDLVEVFYRTSRKYNAGVLSISQNPGDFLSSAIAGVLINNSSVKYVLKLEKGHEALSRFGLNDNEIGAVRELEVRPGYFSEVFVKFGANAVLLRYEPNPLEYWISTTDPVDRSEEFRVRNSSNRENVLEIDLLSGLASRFPNGVKKGKEQLCA